MGNSPFHKIVTGCPQVMHRFHRFIHNLLGKPVEKYKKLYQV